MSNLPAVTPPVNEISAVRYIPFGGTDQIELTIELVKQFLTSPTKSGKLPDKKDIVKYMMLCQSRQLNPWEGDGFLVGYDSQAGPVFNLITAHQAFLKRAEASENYDGMESGVVVRKNGDDEKDVHGEIVPVGYVLVGGWARVFRKDRSHPMYKKLDLKAFDKGHSVWNTNKVGMIVKCAEADALRSTFPNKLGNLYIEGERMPVDAVEVESPAEKKVPASAVKPNAASLKQALQKPVAAAPVETVTEPEKNDAPKESAEPEQAEADSAAPENSEPQEAPYPDTWKIDRKKTPEGATLPWENHTPMVLAAKSKVDNFKMAAIWEARYRLVNVYDKPIPSDETLFEALKSAAQEQLKNGGNGK